jgi:hypothetical protein
MTTENIITLIITCLATITSSVLAVVAIFQTKKQIELSNKQNLFKDRVTGYLILKGLINLYNENRNQIEEEKKEGIYFNCEFLFYEMINNSYLEPMGEVMKSPLHNPEQKEFLKLLEDLRNNAEKMEFIFEGEVAIKIKEFMLAYAELLMELYKYRILIDKMSEYAKSYPVVDINKAAEDMKEIDYRNRLFNCFENIKNKFVMLENIDMEVITEQIKIKDK